MRELQLTTSDEPALVDDWNYDYLNQWDWYIHSGYVQRQTQKGNVYLHREVLSLAGYTDFGIGDHRNRNSLDNQKKNLRPATYSQNAQNQGIRRDNTTGLIGVSPWCEKWIVDIKSNKVTTYLGLFEDSDKGGEAYDVGALYFHDPDFVVLNFKRSFYPAGHPSTWPPGPYSDVIRRCQGRQICNSVSGYWYVWRVKKSWRVGVQVNEKMVYLGTFKEDSPDKYTALLQAVKVADIAAIHLDRDKINLGRTHYPPGNPRDWPEDAIPNCPALRRLIHD